MSSKRKKLTAEELAVIEEHFGRLQLAADRMYQKWGLIVRRTSDSAAAKHLVYWTNYRSAMRHAIVVARQRAGVGVNG